ncbi:cytochrome C [Kaistella polysaccharea]|uniref:cytochrome C n=1 Tax=Kaistella polysaccharea TaxID=2878534 RepID=UPI001CF5809D|nr:cytochrome C [Kaistella polysaccharea]
MNNRKLKNTSNPTTFLLFAFVVIGTAFSCTPKLQTASNTVSAEYLAKGKIIFENSCAKCHDLPNASDHSAEAWTGIMNEMAPKAKLTAPQHQMVYNYIVSVKK